MKQKSEFSVIGRAMATVAGFDRVYRTLEQQVVLRGQEKALLKTTFTALPRSACISTVCPKT